MIEQNLEQTIQPGIYKHYRGGQYEVMGVGLLEATEEPVVIYKALYENDKSQLWVRPVASFLELVTINDTQVPRFQRVQESIQPE